MRPKIPAIAGLVIVTAIWGLTFVVMKEAIEEIPPLQFLALRFGLAAAVMMVLFPRRVPELGGSLRGGLWAGSALSVGYAAQTLGLQHIGATESGFITGMLVIFTPLIGAFWLRQAPSVTAMGAAVTAATGLFLLLGGRGLLQPGSGLGAGLTLLCAMSFAVHVLVLARHSPSGDARNLTTVQMIVATVAFTTATLVAEDQTLHLSANVLGAIALTGIGASAGAFLVMTWAQKHLSATQTAVTLTMEPVFAGSAGAVFLNERLSPAGILGALLILAAMISVNLSRGPVSSTPGS